MVQDWTQGLTVGTQVISPLEVLPLLDRYRLLPQLVREILIDQAIAPFPCGEEELSLARQQVMLQNQLTTRQQLDQWLAQQNLTLEQFNRAIARPLRLVKFQQQQWGHQVQSYFVQNKNRFDRAVYSLVRLRLQNMGIAQELYFRILEGEEDFAAIAKAYSQGPEAQTGGVVGPVELQKIHPRMAERLLKATAGEVVPPFSVDGWWVILRLDKFLPASLDENLTNQVLNEFFEQWLQTQVQQTIAAMNPAPTAI